MGDDCIRQWPPRFSRKLGALTKSRNKTRPGPSHWARCQRLHAQAQPRYHPLSYVFLNADRRLVLF